MDGSSEAWGREIQSFKLKALLCDDVTKAHRETGICCTCMETCQGQEWGIASTPLTTLAVAVLGFTAGFPQFCGQSGKRECIKLSFIQPVFIIHFCCSLIRLRGTKTFKALFFFTELHF